MLHLRAAMRGVEAARSTIRSHRPDRVLGWVVVLERQPGSHRELHSGDGHYQLHRGGSAGGACGVSRSSQRRLWRETVLPGGAAAYNLMLAPGQLKPTR
jgi:hypothetical protein